MSQFLKGAYAEKVRVAQYLLLQIAGETNEEINGIVLPHVEMLSKMASVLDSIGYALREGGPKRRKTPEGTAG